MLNRSIAAVAVCALVIAGAWFVTKDGDARDPIVSAMAAAPRGSTGVSVTVWSRLPKDAGRDLTNRSVGADLGLRAGLAWDAVITTPKGPVVVLALDGLNRKTATKALAANFDQVTSVGSLVIASDIKSALRLVIDTVHGSHQSLLANRAATEVTEAVAGRSAAVFDDGRIKCTGSPELDAADLAGVKRLESQHGALADPRWIARAADADKYVFAEAFGSAHEARGQREIRTALTIGPFIGRRGSVEDSLTQAHTVVDGATVIHSFTPTGDSEPFLVDAGPVVFNGCAL